MGFEHKSHVTMCCGQGAKTTIEGRDCHFNYNKKSTAANRYKCYKLQMRHEND